MDNTATMVDKAKSFVFDAFKNRDVTKLHYHNLKHTQAVVAAADEIGKHTRLTAEEREIVLLAAWFHDLGYLESRKNHELHSAKMAEKFLEENGYPIEKTDKVKSCIAATKVPTSPANRMQEVLCDADMIHLAGADYRHRSNHLRQEMDEDSEEKISEKKWLKSNLGFLKNHQFYTDYAIEKYGPAVTENYRHLKEDIKGKDKSKKKKKLRKKVAKLERKVEKAKRGKPSRGIETMFRLTSKNHIELSAMADSKANIMISINAIILSVVLSLLIRKLEEYPHMTIPAILLTVVALATIVLAVLATRPNVTKGRVEKEDILKKKGNLLFFGNFYKMKVEDYEWGVSQMREDADYLYGSLTRDIFYLGVVLHEKYRLLRICYTVFMFGFVISVIAFVVAQIFFAAPYPY